MSDRDAASCASCGYDLRGSPERGACPECGVPFLKSQLAAETGEVPRWLLKTLIVLGILGGLASLLALVLFPALPVAVFIIAASVGVVIGLAYRASVREVIIVALCTGLIGTALCTLGLVVLFMVGDVF